MSNSNTNLFNFSNLSIFIRKYALEEKERHLQAGWDLKQEERERYVTITLDVVDAEKGYMIQLGVRPTVNMHSVKHPKAKTLKQLKDQYERLQDYGKYIQKAKREERCIRVIWKNTFS